MMEELRSAVYFLEVKFTHVKRLFETLKMSFESVYRVHNSVLEIWQPSNEQILYRISGGLLVTRKQLETIEFTLPIIQLGIKFLYNIIKLSNKILEKQFIEIEETVARLLREAYNNISAGTDRLNDIMEGIKSIAGF